MTCTTFEIVLTALLLVVSTVPDLALAAEIALRIITLAQVRPFFSRGPHIPKVPRGPRARMAA